MKIQGKNLAIVLILLSTSCVSTMQKSIQSGNRQDVVTRLDGGDDINQVDENGNTLLHTALLNAKADIAFTLIERGIKLNRRNNSGVTALMMAAGFYQNEVVEKLLKSGSDPLIADGQGVTPIHIAAGVDNQIGLNLLLARSGKTDVQDNFGYTPLFYSVLMGNYLYDTMLTLEKHNANFDAIDRDGDTPFLMSLDPLARNKKRIPSNFAVFWLMNRQHMTSIPKSNRDVSLTLLAHKARNKSVKNRDGVTMLHLSAMHGLYRLSEYLLNNGADVNAVDMRGNTPIHNAIVGLVLYKTYTETFKLLYSKAADINIQNSVGSSYLHMAVLAENKEVLETVLKSGIDTSLKNENGLTAYELAKSRNNSSSTTSLQVLESFNVTN